jgi:hypothetical protein
VRSASAHRIIARNTATKSENQIHDDSTARRYGFSGGLVPGVTVYAYMCRLVIDQLGLAWMENGRISARFLKPVYHGHEITIESRPMGDGTDLELKVIDSSGTVCATGECGVIDSPPTVDPAAYPNAPLPEVRPAATAEAFAAEPLLGSVQGTFSADGGRTYLELIGEDPAQFVHEPLAHPGWLLTWANLALTSNFVLGPWIHVSSEVQNLSSVKDGERIDVRGRVIRTFERKGHQFVELDLLLRADERAAAQIHHVAIYQPRAH